MSRKVLITLISFLLAVSAQATEKGKINDSESFIISGLHDVAMMSRVEGLCYDWEAGTMSNMQIVYSTGIYTVLKQRLGKEQFYRYYRASKKETTSLIDIDLIRYWKAEGNLEAVKIYCTEDLPAIRRGIANQLINSVSDVLEEK